MRLSICVLAVTLILVPSALLADASVRLGKKVRPISEHIALTLDPDKPAYSGVATIQLKVIEATRSFDLNLQDLEPETITLMRGSQSVAGIKSERAAASRLVINAPRQLMPGDYTLRVPFHGNLGTKGVGLYRVVKDGSGYVFTQFEPADARKAVPCWDEPAFKIPYQIALTIPRATVAVSNTPVERETSRGEQKTVVFRRTKPLPSYLVALTAGPLEFVPVPGTHFPARIVTLKGQKELGMIAAERVAPIVAAEEKYFGRPYPSEKLDLIAVPEYWWGAMENPGAITFLDSILLIDPKAATLQQKAAFDDTFAHELAHQWFGDLVTMVWWDDLWLNESFANWMANKVMQEVRPELGTDALSLQDIERAMQQDARLTTHAVRREVLDPDQVYTEPGITYSKGEAILAMFEEFLGAATFRKGINDYLKQHEYGNATSADLWKALSSASGHDIGRSMSTFIGQPGYPLVEIEPAAGSFRLSQQRFANASTTAPAQTWSVPMTLEFSKGGPTEKRSVLLDAHQMSVSLDPATVKWLEPNANARGYYRWSLPPAMIAALASDASGHLNVRERMDLVSNATALLDAGRMHSDTYLDLLSRLSNDPSPSVLFVLLDSIGNAYTTFVTPPLGESFAAYVRKTLQPAVKRYGLDPRAGEDAAVNIFRPRLIDSLANFGNDPEVIEFARKKAASYLEDPSSVDASIAPQVLMVAAANGDQAMFDLYRKRFETAGDPRMRATFLAALGNFRDPKLREEALAYGLSGSLRANEIFAIPFGGERTEQARQKRFEWVLEHWSEMIKRVPTELQSIVVAFGGGCNAERIEATRKYFSDPAHQVEGAADRLEKVTEAVNDCIALRAREQTAVAKYLSGN